LWIERLAAVSYPEESHRVTKQGCCIAPALSSAAVIYSPCPARLEAGMTLIGFPTALYSTDSHFRSAAFFFLYVQIKGLLKLPPFVFLHLRIIA
jgi:hypothetical protein